MKVLVYGGAVVLLGWVIANVVLEHRDGKVTGALCSQRIANEQQRFGPGAAAGGADAAEPGGGGQSASSARLPQPVDSRAQALAAPAQLTFPFGRDRSTLVRHQSFMVPADLPIGDITVTAPFGDVVDVDGKVVPYTQLAGEVTRRGPGRLFTVAACINPVVPAELSPGTYSGSILVGSDDRQASIGLQATVQDDRWWRIADAALLGAIAGLFVKLFAEARTSTGETRMRDHARGVRFAVAIGAAVVTAVYSILTIYLDDATFSATADNLWRITAEVFAGTLAAKAISDLAAPKG
jgi:hypothetical protein